VTASAPYAGGIEYNVSELVEEDAVDTSLAVTLLNNLIHTADQRAQVRVAFTGLSGSFLTCDTIGAGNTDTFLPIASFGPFDATLKTDGTPYLMRIRIAGRASAANSVTFRVAICPGRGALTARGLDYVRNRIANNGADVLEATTSATAVAWLAPANTSADPAIIVADAVGQELTQDVTGGTAASVAVDTAQMMAHVWASSTTSGTQPRLDGLYVAEFHD